MVYFRNPCKCTRMNLCATLTKKESGTSPQLSTTQVNLSLTFHPIMLIVRVEIPDYSRYQFISILTLSKRSLSKSP